MCARSSGGHCYPFFQLVIFNHMPYAQVEVGESFELALESGGF